MPSAESITGLERYEPDYTAQSIAPGNAGKASRLQLDATGPAWLRSPFGMMALRTKITVAVVASCLGLTGLVAVSVVGPEPHFVCHKAIDGALQQWMLEATNEVRYPNVGGSSSQSLALLMPYLHEGTNPLRDYRYVPGLRLDDPEDLIMLYMREPSRRTWHGDTHWFRMRRRWVILNPRMSTPFDVDARGWSECGEAISTVQLRTRLKATLDFLKSNGRPQWPAIADEHTKFLRAIKE